MANKLEKGLCLTDLCVRVDLPEGVVYAKSLSSPPTLTKNQGTRRRRRKSSTSADDVVPAGNGTTSVIWSGISLQPGRVGKFFVEMRVVGARGGHLPGVLNIQGSVYQCGAQNACKGNVPPTSVRLSVQYWMFFHTVPSQPPPATPHPLTSNTHFTHPHLQIVVVT